MVGAALGSAAALVLSAAPAPAAPAGQYVALGDSYSSGTGTENYIDDGTECLRSTLAWPSLTAATQGLPLNFRACSGATISDVTGVQLSALSASTTQVSLSVGGNDAGFADVLTECALPGWASDCNEAIDGAVAFVNGTLPGSLATLYASIGSRAPSADVVVAGYPRIFQGEDCNALTFFSPEEEARLNAMADLINTRISSAASSAGFSFANPTSAFIGHAVCDDPEWLNGLSNPIASSFHPNVLGHRGYAAVVSPYVTAGSPGGEGVTATDRANGARGVSAAVIAKQQRAYAAVDATITPKLFHAPDLSSPRVKAAAVRAGVDLDSRVSIESADRAWSARQAAAR